MNKPIIVDLSRGFRAHITGQDTSCMALSRAIQSLGTDVLRSFDPWNIDMRNPRPILQDAEVNVKTGIAKADAPLFFNARWARSIAHGSDMIFPVARLAQRLLTPGDSITAVSGGFEKQATHDIHIVIYDPTLTQGADQKGEQYGSGEFKTLQGRTLRYQILAQKYNTIQGKRERNPLAEAVIRENKVTHEGPNFSVPYDPKMLQIIGRDFQENPEFQTSSMLEVATFIGREVFRRLKEEEKIKYEMLFVRSVENLPVSLDGFQSTEEETLPARIIRRKNINSWNYLFIEIIFPFARGEKTKLCLAYK
ncbi:MAG: hypothetical protein HHAS10_05410 [Candidatus Altimarinota bacterium]